MDPITHALTAGAVARAGLGRATRLATPILVVSAIAPDLDWLARAIGPLAFLDYYRTATHALLPGAVLAAAIAVLFWWFGRKHPTAPVRLGGALIASAAGLATHLLLDLSTSHGARLLWPFRDKWTAWDLTTETDPWMLFILVPGLLVPGLFRLISEEIGARPATRSRQRWAIAALVLLVIYGGGRYILHDRAMSVLGMHLYHDAAPLAVAAFPTAVSPLRWQGVVETENTVETIEVPLGPGAYFLPDRSVTHYKPEASPALEAARRTLTIERYLKFARFPKATVMRQASGYRVEVRDLRFTGEGRPPGWAAVVELDEQSQPVHEEIRFITQLTR